MSTKPDQAHEALWSMYGETISTRKFSREKADQIKGMSAFWRPFKTDERRKIDGILARSQLFLNGPIHDALA